MTVTAPPPVVLAGVDAEVLFREARRRRRRRWSAGIVLLVSAVVAVLLVGNKSVPPRPGPQPHDGGPRRQEPGALPQPSLSTATEKAASGCIRVQRARSYGPSAHKDPEALTNKQSFQATISRSTSPNPVAPVVEPFSVRQYLE